MVNSNHVSANPDTCKDNGKIVVDSYTGEVLESIVAPVEYLPPIDISSITSKGVFDSIVSKRMVGVRYRLVVSNLLLDIIVERELTITELSIFCLLGQKIGYNNMVYTTMSDISKGSGYSRQTVSSALAELKRKGLLKEPNKLTLKGDRFILVHPLYFFLGYYPHRDGLIKDWVLGR